MAIHLTLILVLFSSLSVKASNCHQSSESDPILYGSHFKWGLSKQELLSLFDLTYQRPERLSHRAYLDNDGQTVILPYDADRGGAIRVSYGFIESVQSHIEQALKLNFIEGVFFSDMGHSHLLIPESHFEQSSVGSNLLQMSRFYERVLTHPDVLILYHTAEQLKFLDSSSQVLPDSYSQWRFKTRNLLGGVNPATPVQTIQNPESQANTAGSLPGYRWWGAGFNLSANKHGCFTYREPDGNIRRFDISMYDLTYPPQSGSLSDP